MPNDPIQRRIAAVRQKLPAVAVDTFMVSIDANRRYLSGFQAEDGQFDETAGVLLINAEALVLATDSRYIDAARREAPDYETVCYRKGLVKALPDLLSRLDRPRPNRPVLPPGKQELPVTGETQLRDPALVRIPRPERSTGLRVPGSECAPVAAGSNDVPGR